MMRKVKVKRKLFCSVLTKSQALDWALYVCYHWGLLFPWLVGLQMGRQGGGFTAELQALTAEGGHAGFFSILLIPSSAKLSSPPSLEQGRKRREALSWWAPVNPLSLSSGHCRAWHRLFAFYWVLSAHWIHPQRTYRLSGAGERTFFSWSLEGYLMTCPASFWDPPSSTNVPLGQSPGLSPAETLFQVICLLTTPTR